MQQVQPKVKNPKSKNAFLGYGRLESAEMLLGAGADLQCVNADGQKPLDVAKVNRETVMIEFLNKRLQSDEPDPWKATLSALVFGLFFEWPRFCDAEFVFAEPFLLNIQSFNTIYKDGQKAEDLKESLVNWSICMNLNQQS